MDDALTYDLLTWIKKLHHTCLELNEALIRSFQLEQEPLLQEYNRFEWPPQAVKHRLIPRHGSIAPFRTQRPITYHVHGSGITLFADAAKVFFEYYPKTGPNRQPVLGPDKLHDFIRSLNPLDACCDDARIKDGLRALFQRGTLVRLHESYFAFYLPPAER